ncbi:MAG: OB-fold domain-containing protein [Rubrivivax sp.]
MSTPYQDRPLGQVVVDAATEPYWAAARDGVLKLRRCMACQRPHWYPRPMCPFCQGDTEWVDAAGTGEIYSVSVTRRAGPIPYALAFVKLDEGVTMMSNIVDCDLDGLSIGQRVRLVFKPADGGQPVPMFTPA